MAGDNTWDSNTSLFEEDEEGDNTLEVVTDNALEVETPHSGTKVVANNNNLKEEEEG